MRKINTQRWQQNSNNNNLSNINYNLKEIYRYITNDIKRYQMTLIAFQKQLLTEYLLQINN